MAVTYAYGLHHWVWNDDTKSHNPPPGAVSSLDLRPLSEQALPAQAAGYGFFAWQVGPGVDSSLQIPADAIPLGVGDCRELRPTTAQRQSIRSALSLASAPAGEFLIDCVADVLGAKADPLGESGPKPLLPSENGLEIYLDNHSKVWSLAYEPEKVLSSAPTGRDNRIRDVLRNDIELAFDTGGIALASKVLGAVLLKHGYSLTELRSGAPGKTAEWRRLISPKLLAKAGADLKPSRPKTSYTDDFNRSDGAIGGNWNNILVATGPTIAFDILSNQMKITATGNGAAAQPYTVYRYDSDVSSSDHWSQYTLITTDGYANSPRTMGPIVRCSSSANTFYSRYSRVANGSESFNSFFKMIAGTVTTLTSTSNLSTGGFNQLYKLSVSGSTLSAWFYTPLRTATDTAITGNTRGGLFHQFTLTSTTKYVIIDNWSVDDGLTAGSVGPCFGNTGKTIGGRIFSGSILQ